MTSLTDVTQCGKLVRMSNDHRMNAAIRFADRLRDIKINRKLTFQRMTEILGRSSPRTVQDWVYGSRVPHRDIQELVLLKLLKARAARIARPTRKTIDRPIPAA